MKTKRVLIIVSSVLLIAVIGLLGFRGTPGNGGDSGNPDAQLFADRALNVFASLKNGDFENATRDFNKQFKAVADPMLKQEWSKGLAVCGPLKEYVITHAEDDNESSHSIYCVYVTCRFEKGKLYGVVKFDPQKTISQFSVYGRPQR